MSRYILRPNADTKADWTESPIGTAFSVLDDSVEQPTAATTGSDRITTSSTAQTSAQGLETFTLGGSEVVVGAKAWVYGKAVDVSNYYSIALYSGGVTLASTNYTSGSFGWGSATYTGSLTQSQIDNLEVRIISIGTGSLEADAAYVEVVTHSLTGTAKATYDAIQAFGSVGLLWVAEPSGTVVPDHSGNFRHGDFVGDVTATTAILSGGQASLNIDPTTNYGGILARSYTPYTVGSSRTFIAVTKKDTQVGATAPTVFGGSGVSGAAPNTPHPTWEYVSASTIRFYPTVNTFPAGWADIAVGDYDNKLAILDFEYDDATSICTFNVNGRYRGTTGPTGFGSVTMHYDTLASAGNFIFGYRGAGSNLETFDGKVEMVAVIERALTPAERISLATAAGLREAGGMLTKGVG